MRAQELVSESFQLACARLEASPLSYWAPLIEGSKECLRPLCALQGYTSATDHVPTAQALARVLPCWLRPAAHRQQ
jgi:hypothetical protein